MKSGTRVRHVIYYNNLESREREIYISEGEVFFHLILIFWVKRETDHLYSDNTHGIA